MDGPTAFEEARDRWRGHAVGCLHCGFNRQCPTGEVLNARWKQAAQADYEARRNAGPVAAYLREGERIAAEAIQPAARPTGGPPEARPTADWTDDEWIAAMTQFPPNTPIAVAEAWVAARREA